MKRRFFYVLFTMLLSAHLNAQKFTKDSINNVVTKVAAYLQGHYPFAEIGNEYSAMLHKNMPQYLSVATRELLAERINNDLQKIHKDVHLNISIIPENEGVTKVFREDDLIANNYGFKTVELDKTTGSAYISIPHGFNCSQEGFEMAGHAMNMAAYSRYVIIDIRGNGGGAGGMGHFLASYFFEPGTEKLYLDAFTRTTKNIQEFTYGYVPGKRLTHTKLYILIDNNTASASEGFAFAMQKFKKATIVGTTSAGAGIAGMFLEVGDRFEMFLPIKMIVAPGTNEGWEGTGVLPDVDTGKEDALAATKKLIIREELKKTGLTGENIEVLQWKMEDVDFETKLYQGQDAELQPGELVKKYSEKESIQYHNHRLYWVTASKNEPVRKFELLPVRKDVFVVVDLYPEDGRFSTRLYINRNKKNKITGVTRKVLVEGRYIDTRVINIP
jgi:hypothetical protein